MVRKEDITATQRQQKKEKTMSVITVNHNSVEIDMKINEGIVNVEIDINELYEETDFIVWGHSLNEYRPENIDELSDEELKDLAINAGAAIDREIQENLIGMEQEHYGEIVETAIGDQLDYLDIEYTEINIEWTGTYSLTAQYTFNERFTIVSDWKN